MQTLSRRAFRTPRSTRLNLINQEAQRLGIVPVWVDRPDQTLPAYPLYPEETPSHQSPKIGGYSVATPPWGPVTMTYADSDRAFRAIQDQIYYQAALAAIRETTVEVRAEGWVEFEAPVAPKARTRVTAKMLAQRVTDEAWATSLLTDILAGM